MTVATQGVLLSATLFGRYKALLPPPFGLDGCVDLFEPFFWVLFRFLIDSFLIIPHHRTLTAWAMFSFAVD
jgi:hypothetical protein